MKKNRNILIKIGSFECSMKKSRKSCWSRTILELCACVGSISLAIAFIAQVMVLNARFQRNAVLRNVGNVVPESEPVVAETVVVKQQTLPVKKQNLHLSRPGLSVVGAMQARMQARVAARNKVQAEVRELERSLSKLMRENTVTHDESVANFRSDLFARRVGGIIQRAHTHGVTPHKVNGSRLRHQSYDVQHDVAKQSVIEDDERDDDEEAFYNIGRVDDDEDEDDVKTNVNITNEIASRHEQSDADADIEHMLKSGSRLKLGDFDNSAHQSIVVNIDVLEENVRPRGNGSHVDRNTTNTQFDEGDKESRLWPNGTRLCPILPLHLGKIVLKFKRRIIKS